MPDWNVAAIDASCVSGMRELAGVLDHRLHVADRDRAAGDLQAADDGDQDELDVADEDHHRLDQARHELGAEARLVELVVVGAEPGLDLALAAEALHDRVAGEHLLGLGVDAAGVAPLAMNRGRALPPMYLHQPERQPAPSTSAIDRQQRRDREHHDRHADEGEERREDLADRLLQALGEVVDVVGDPAQQVAAGLAVDVAERQPVELVLDRFAQRVHRALHDAGEDVRLRVGERPRRQVQARRPASACGAARRSRCPSRWSRRCTMMSVAWPSRRGPSTTSTTLPTASTSTTSRRSRSGPRIAPSRRTVAPNRSLRSTGMPTPPPGPNGPRRAWRAGGGEDRLIRRLRRCLAVACRSSVMRPTPACWEATISAYVSARLRAVRRGVPAPTTRRPRARGSGRRGDRRHALGDDHAPRRRSMCGASAARRRASVARSSAENESSNT